MDNGVQLDDAKNVTINPDGSLFRDGITKFQPKTEEETGYKYFKVDSDTEPGEKEKRYVHVEVLRHHGSIPNLPHLGPEDVEHIDGKKFRNLVQNLKLTESGLRKYNGEPEPEPAEEPKDTEPEKETTDPAEDDGDEEPSDEEESAEFKPAEPTDEVEAPDEPTPEVAEESDPVDEEVEEPSSEEAEEPAEETAEEVSQKVFHAVKTSEGSNYHDLIDPDTGESVLEVFNDGKKINGAKNVEKVAEEHGIEVVIKD